MTKVINIKNGQQFKQMLRMVIICMSLFVNELTVFCQIKNSDCIKKIEDYYSTLNDYSKYYSSMSENAVKVFFTENNIVYNDLRTFQEGRSIDKQKNISAYLLTLKNLSSSGKVEYKSSVKKVRKEYVSTEDYKGNVFVLDVSKKVTYKGEKKEFDETVTMNEKGQIVKIETIPHFHIPWTQRVGLFDPLDKQLNFHIWGSTNLAFGLSVAYEGDYFSFGYGTEMTTFFINEYTTYIGGNEPDYLMNMLAIYLQPAVNFSYWSVGLNAGLGHYYSLDSYLPSGASAFERPSLYGMVLMPFASINLFESISVSVGYNFNIFNGKEFNGLRFGLGFWLD